MNNNGCFVTGIGTDVGKTICSAIICQGTAADYWKPIQCGMDRDSQWIKSHTTNIRVHKEVHCFQNAVSPHTAATRENQWIHLDQLRLPVSDGPIVVEGAGGIFVPLNDKEFMIDLMEQVNLPVVVVAKFYIGAINHTILTIKTIQERGLFLHGIVGNGNWSNADQNLVAHTCDTQFIGNIPWTEKINSQVIAEIAQEEWVHEIMA